MELQEYLDQLEQRRGLEAFRQADREVNTLTKRLEGAGIEPDTDSQPGFIQSFFDTLDTPRQWLAGTAAKLSGIDEYSNLGFLDAAKLGAKEDLTTSELLRKAGILEDHDYLRAALGFVGDVVTDPTSYITLGGGAGAKIAGKTVANSIKTSAGMRATTDVIEGLRKSKLDELVSGFKARGIAGDELETLIGQAERDAAQHAARPIEQAASLIKNKKELAARGAEDAGIDLAADFAAREAKIREQLDLAADADLEQLFKKPALRIAGVFSGSDKFANIPVLGQASTDIPLVTDATEKLFQSLGGPLYNARINASQAVDGWIKEGEKMGGSAARAAKILRGIKSAPEAVSRRIAAGGTRNRRVIEEHEIAGHILKQDVKQQAAALFGDLKEEEAHRITEVLESGLQINSNAATAVLKANPGLSPEGLNQLLFENSLNALRKEYNADSMGRGDKLADLVLRVKEDFANYAIEGEERGILNNVVEDYLPHLYKAKEGEIPNYFKTAQFDRAREGKQAFMFERHFDTLQKAADAGLSPEKDIRKIWMARTIAQKKSLADLDFMERLGYEAGLPEHVYQKLNEAVAGKNVEAAAAAKAILYGMQVDDPGKLLEVFQQKNYADLLMPDGKVISPEYYEHALKTLSNYNPVSEESMKVLDRIKGIKSLKFDGSPEELERIVQANDAVKTFRTGLTGRAGESVYTRAGAQVVPESFTKVIEKSKHLDEADKQFFRGILPGPVARAVKESQSTLETLKQLQKSAKASGDPALEAPLANLTSAYLGWTRLAKRITTATPSFHLRNLFSLPLMAVQEVSLLGQALNPVNLVQNHKVMSRGADMVDNLGRRITARQLNQELQSFGFKHYAGSAMDLLGIHGEGLTAAMKDPPKNLVGKVFNTGLKALDVNASIANRIESMGRSQMYLSLRRNGYDPNSAYHATQKAMINYTNGKTRFERHWLNNLFFFYSFARGNASNSIANMLTRPGALTAQLHTVNGVANAIRDYGDGDLEDDLEDKIYSLRAKESLARYVGKGKNGMPEIMVGAGVPFEDVARYFNFRAPKELTLKDVVESGQDGMKRTLQTVAAQTTPWIKGVIEMASGKNLFFDRPLTDKTIAKMPSIAEAGSKLLGFNPKSVPANVIETMQESVMSALQLNPRKNVDGSYRVNPYSLAVLAMVVPGFDRYKSLVGAAARDDEPDAKALRLLSGVKIQEVDPAKAEVFEQRRRLREQAEREGVPTLRRQREERAIMEMLERS